ncbi:MAG: VanZ family protein [Pedobacter sp.]
MIKFPASVRLVLFVAFAMLIFVLSVIPRPPHIIRDVLSWDKAQHALAYAFLTALGGWALAPFWGAARAWSRALGLAIVYGVLLEGAQALTGQRVAQFGDAVANTFGAGLVYLLWRIFFRPTGVKSCK